MKKSLLFFFLIISGFIIAQCPNDNTFSLDATPPCPGTQTITNVNGGSSYTVNVVSGNTYTFSTCGNTAFDSQITVYNGAAVIGYNDDACGLQSEVTWTATFTGTITVLVDQFNCQNTGTGAELVVQCELPIQTGDGCNTDITICTPGIAGPFAFSTPGNPVGSCLDWIGLTYAYIILYITESGPLQLLVDGDATTGFLDVAIFDIPSGQDPCVAIENGANEISCNYASSSSGCNQIGTYFPCASSVPSPNVSAGDVLMIVIENWSNASNTFTMDLGPSPAAQTGPPDPTITAVGPFCSTDPSIQLTAVDLGGTWTGPGVNADGLFNPSTAGIGAHTINYSIGSGPCEASSTTSLSVIDCVQPCNMATLNATIGSCLPDNTFTVTGTFSYQNAPATGTVVVTVTNSSGSLIQTFNPPFVNNQIYNFSIPGNNSNGSALTVTVAFSNAPTCLLTVSSTSPAACGCVADIGTFTATTTGPGTANYVLCFGDEIDITADGNYTPPAPANNPPLPEGYEPGITWLVYSCPPTIAVTPSNVPPNDFIGNDPCLIGLYSDFDMYDINDQFWMTNYPGVFTNNIVYFVPITMYNLTEAYYSYVNTSIDCYEMGAPFAVQYLTDITFTQAQTCTNVTVTISGGLPALNGSQFTGSNLTPANASFVNTTANNGGTIAITGLTPGQAYSFQVTDANGCPKTISGTFVGGPILSYPQTAYCPVGTASPTITGTAGGTYSSTAGLSINTSTGIINLAASTPNTYIVTYTTPAIPGPACPATFVITINPLPIVFAGNNVIVCEGSTVTLTGSGANTYTWNPVISDGIAFVPLDGTTTYTVTGTSAAGCINTDQVDVIVGSVPVVSFTPDVTIGCAPLTVNLTNTTANSADCVWSISNGTVLNGCGTVTVTFTQGGCYDVTLTTTSNNGCVGTLTSTDVICVEALPIASFNPSSNILSTLNTEVLFTNTSTGATSYLWNFGDESQSSNVTNPTNIYPGEPGTYQVMLVAYSPLGCTDTAYTSIIIYEELIFYIPNTFTPDDDNFNPIFQPVFTAGFDPYDFTLLIFNRWGEIIFESHDASIGWNGTYGSNGEIEMCQDGTYTWKIEFKTNKNDERKMVVGHVNLIR